MKKGKKVTHRFGQIQVHVVQHARSLKKLIRQVRQRGQNLLNKRLKLFKFFNGLSGCFLKWCHEDLFFFRIVVEMNLRIADVVVELIDASRHHKIKKIASDNLNAVTKLRAVIVGSLLTGSANKMTQKFCDAGQMSGDLNGI